MAQKTDLNVAPYYDDHDGANNYVRTLFRPGFALQARELTQLQSQLQHQIEQHGTFVFKEGSMVIPGAISYNKDYYSLKLATQFSGETVDPSQYYNATTPVTITGATSGVTAKVIGFSVATTTDQPTLFIRYESAGTDGFEKIFQDGENISANAGITHTSSYSTSATSATTYTSIYSEAKGSTQAELQGSLGPAAATGSAAIIQDGVYYIRGFFVECSEETLILEKYSSDSNYLVGFTVTENLVTPEGTTSLLDNATGSSNFAAKGAHRLQLSLALAKYARDATIPTNFVQLLDVKDNKIQAITKREDLNILEKTLATRTYDESGDYTVAPFNVVVRESTTLNEENGVFRANTYTDDGNIAANDLLAIQVSTGKAYVKGYEIEKLSPTFVDLSKSRGFETVNAGITQFDLGQYTLVNNVYGTPDITAITGETTAFKTVALYPNFGATRGEGNHPSTTGLCIGQCRIRAFEQSTGTPGTNEAQYKAYVFDIRMFTYITLSDTPSATLTANFTQGAKITGSTSGATGFIVNNSDINATTTATQLVVMKTSGRFSTGETFTVSDSAEGDKIVENSSNVDITLVANNEEDADNTHTFQQVRSMIMLDSDSGQNFTADLVLSEITGRKGQLENLIVNAIDGGGADANSLFGAAEAGDPAAYGSSVGTGGIVLETRKFAKLTDTDKANMLEKLPRQVIKTLLTATNSGITDTQYTVRRQFVGTTSSAGVVTFAAGANETFVAHAEKDYVMSILTAGGGTGIQGQLVSVATAGTMTISGTGSTQITITDNTVLGSAAKVKLIATILKTSVKQKTKTVNLMKQVKVATGTSDAYGTRPDDREISLGRADAFKLVAVYDSQDTTVDAVAPTMTISSVVGTFVRGEKVTGTTSSATARIIETSSPISFVQKTGTFVAGEKITGASSGAVASIGILTTGDTVLTSRYLLDTGQRDSFYDIARIVRKRGASSPIGKVLIIYDYFEHGTGDMFTVDSYVDVAKQMEYDDIPTYTASKVDTEDPNPSGAFPLYDTYDFRPRVDNITGASVNLSTVDEITGNSFNFFERSYSGTGGSTVDVPKPGSFVQSDFEYYLPKYASLLLSSEGDFLVITGQSAENPLLPKNPEGAMLVATMFLPAYTFRPQNVTIRRMKHQRYTMKDIGKIAKRLDNVEYYTALSLLERDAESFEVVDDRGLNRFKSGFMVDNFKGHRVGDSAHRDYKNSMDFQLGELRPAHRSKGIDLIEQSTTDADRTSRGYQKTGDLITLPYTNETVLEQPIATRLERVNPFLIASWTGTVTLTPSSDTWFETDILPDLIQNEEGDYDAVLARERNNLGTVWNSWQTQWSGVVETRSENWTEGGSQVRPDRFDVVRTTNTVRTDQTRTGVNTQVALRVDRVSQGERVISVAAIPIMRARTIKFYGAGFLPNTRLYAFFNKQNVDPYVYPFAVQTEGGSESTTGLSQGTAIVTDSVGNAKGNFLIPDPKGEGNPKFSTGNVEFKLTTSPINGVVGTDKLPGSSGSAIFAASGMLETRQETIIATRNADVSRTSLSGTTSFNTQSSNTQRTAAGNWNEEQAAVNYAIMLAELNRLEIQGITAETRALRAQVEELATRPAVINNITNITNNTAVTNVTNITNVTQQNQGWNGGRGWFRGWDPIAQTFTIPKNVGGEGRFITSVDVFFGAKDANVPVVMEIRNVVNGYPGSKVLPFGRVTKAAADITVDSTGATATTFTFPSPVFVEVETEYCFVLISYTPEHKVFIARMGEDDIVSGQTVSDQPAWGILFKSHNNTGWAISPMEDLKYTLKCASFNKSGGICTLTNDVLPAATLKSDPVVITDASTIVKIKHQDHHMYSNENNVTIAKVASGLTTTLNGAITSTATTLTLTSGTNFGNTSGIYNNTTGAAGGFWFIKIGDEVMKYNTISTNAVSGLQRAEGSTTAAAHADGATVEFYMVYKIPLTEINKTHTSITNSEIDSYTITTTSTPDVGTDGVAQVGGKVTTATENALMDYFTTNIGVLELPNTSITSDVLVVTSTSPSGSQTSYLNTRNDETISPIEFPLNDNYEFDKPYMVTSAINEANELDSRKSIEFRLTLRSNTTNLSPVIDLGRLGMVAIANRINNIDSSSDVYPTTDYVGNELNEGDENAAIYLTKQVNLETSATGLKVIVGVHRPANAEVRIMYKLLRADETTDFDDIGFKYFNTDGSPDVTIAPATIRTSFTEQQYTAGIPDDGFGDPLDEFTAFQIKIIMQSTNCAAPPRLRSLRILALGT
jgi:hypothetical protein